ncbi:MULTISPECIES: TPM domain-containing protein [Cyanophyceae]|uniref:TPM domain-containing protein n=1 Tax=Stenomitos frigidus AS-A4 TaxID=2933935 RepID=A0ABV0KFW6_9CYAN
MPNPKRIYGGWVTDMADMLTPETEAKLNRQISALEAKNSSEIAVVTVPDVSPSVNPKAFATELFNAWGIGKKKQDNGVLFLVSKGDRRTEIITGRGLTTLLPDSQISAILQQDVTPKFKRRQFDAGVLAGTKTLIVQVNRYRSSNPSKKVTPPLPAVPSPSRSNQQPAQRQDAAPRITAQPVQPLLTLPNSSGSKSTQTRSIGLQPLQSETIAHPNDSANLLMAILSGLGGGTIAVGSILLYRRLNQVLLIPEGESRVEKAAITGRERFHCATCKQRMEQLTAGELSLFLSEPQQMAQQLGSVIYDGWRCKPCQTSLYGRGFHLRSLVMDAEQFSHCSICDELTANHSSEILKQPTWNQEGKSLITHNCRCCLNQWQTEESIPCLPLPKNAVKIDPIGRSRVNNFHLFQQAESERPTHCSRCRYPMERVSSGQLQHLLQESERVAERLGSVSFSGWQCRTCYPETDTSNIHVRAYILSSHYQICPNCHELTVEETSRTTQSATSHHAGQRQITKRCHCCSFVDERWISIPRLATVSSSSSSSSSWSSTDSSSSSTSSDFGGGSSSGSGSGNSW